MAVRIVGGRFGGRRLDTPAGAGTRPTSDRVREALFSILGPLDGARVLDLFAGSGALGLEAVSRGAASAVLVERSPSAVDALRANVAALKLGRAEAEVRRSEALRAIRSARRRRETYDLIFLDPPYHHPAKLAGELSLDLPVVLALGGRVVGESDHRRPLELALPCYDERRYGDTLIRIHQTQAGSVAP